MTRSRVAILRTKPATVLSDYHELMNLAGYQDVVAKDADTGLRVIVSPCVLSVGRCAHACSGSRHSLSLFSGPYLALVCPQSLG